MSTGWQVFCLFVIVAALAIAPLIAKAQLAKRRRKEDEKEVRWLKAAKLAEFKALDDFESALAALERKATAEKRNLAERRAIRRATPTDTRTNAARSSDTYMPPPAHNYGYGHHAEASPDSFSGGGGHFGGGGSSASYSSESSPSDSGGGDSGGGGGGD